MKSIKPPKRPNPVSFKETLLPVNKRERPDGAVVTRCLRLGRLKTKHFGIHIPRKLTEMTFDDTTSRGGGHGKARKRPCAVNPRAIRTFDFKRSFSLVPL